jgi:hypothetical protein
LRCDRSFIENKRFENRVSFLIDFAELQTYDASQGGRAHSSSRQSPDPQGMPLFFAALYCNIFLAVFLLPIPHPSAADQSTFSTVTIHQVQEVLQGNIGEFEIRIVPEDKAGPITLRLNCKAKL